MNKIEIKKKYLLLVLLEVGPSLIFFSSWVIRKLMFNKISC